MLCPICERPVSTREEEYVEIEKEEELILPTPSQIYYCYHCISHIPWNKVEVVIRKGEIVLLRCAFCGQQPEVRKTVATWLDEQWKKNNFAGRIISFVFPEGHSEGPGPCPECAMEPLLFRAEIGYPLRCARCGAVFIDMLCHWCVHGKKWHVHGKGFYVDGKKVSKLDYCKIKHVTGWVPFCWDFKKRKERRKQPLPEVK